MPSANHTPSTASPDARLIAGIRGVLAVSALLIIFIDPAEPARYVALTYTTLALYTVYSLTLYVLSRQRRVLVSAVMAVWFDVGWYVLLIGLSSGTTSVFFFFFFFVILATAFQLGFTAGLSVTLASVILFTVVGFVAAPAESTFELNRFLLRPLSLLVLGYMIAYWGGAELEGRRRLALLKDVSTLSNPRFGVDRTLGMLLERLRAFYQADACLLVVAEQPTGPYSLRCAPPHTAGPPGQAEPLPDAFARLLLTLPATQAMCYGNVRRLWGGWRPVVAVPPPDIVTDSALEAALQMSKVLATAAFITVPWRFGGLAGGRLYLTASRQRAFTSADLEFLRQVLTHTTPVLDNIRLVDQLASDAAATERQRIAHDLHDSLIQPYLGVQMGVNALRQKLHTADSQISDDVERLWRLTELGLAELRGYVRGLRDDQTREDSLPLAVQRFADKFTETTGIAVQVDVEDTVCLNDRLAAEVFQMIVEGLNNVRQHTSSPRATIGLACHGDQCLVRIENDAEAGLTPVAFTPRSINERATALGGNVGVEATPSGSTVVRIAIPL